ncbi:hypothetical protein VE00_03492 [Pseudogymnoascus sp. WSF 3629]|nr:hypothetical protein VE00_03492 [Pseudogymnoascus sp. WSF 3629]
MAEPFGIVSGAIGIASAFTACVDCFEYFGRDFQTDQLALNCARLRLTRWGESVKVYDDPRLGRQDATATEIQLAKDALLQILVLFADTESTSKKYKLTAKAGVDISLYSTGDMDPKMVALDDKMKGLAIQRQKKLRNCPSSLELLGDLLEQGVTLKLKSFELVIDWDCRHHYGDLDEVPTEVIVRFLASFQGLENLFLLLAQPLKWHLIANNIVNHQSTLKRLVLHDRDRPKYQSFVSIASA